MSIAEPDDSIQGLSRREWRTLPSIARLGQWVSLLGVMFLLLGCAGKPEQPEIQLPPPIPVGQSTDLAGARVDQARSIAMGLARSRGWSIDSASPDQLILSRRVPPGTPMSRIIPRSNGLTRNDWLGLPARPAGLPGQASTVQANSEEASDQPPRVMVRPTTIQVLVHLVPSSRLRTPWINAGVYSTTSSATIAQAPPQPTWSSPQPGTRVILQADLIGVDAEGAPISRELTGAFDNELNISLSALQSAWLESRDKILSDVPVPKSLRLPDSETPWTATNPDPGQDPSPAAVAAPPG